MERAHVPGLARERAVKRLVPWWAKIGLKVVWSRLPIGYAVWKRVGVFRHGFMESPDYVSSVFDRHWKRAEFSRKNSGFQALELGCGDSLASCLMASAKGAAGYYLVDAGAFAVQDIEKYQRIAAALSRSGHPVADIAKCDSVAQMLERTHARYLTAGLRSLQALPDKSIDFIWSQAVLEHLRHAEFGETLRQLRRVLRDDGVMSHRVDLKDHLGGALNNLRFTHDRWESPLMSRSGFYTNRIRFTQMLDAVRFAGFDAQLIQVDRWTSLPTPRASLAPEFQSLSDEELLVSGFDVVMRPR
jgi:SAM-dependent methyltransferase